MMQVQLRQEINRRVLRPASGRTPSSPGHPLLDHDSRPTAGEAMRPRTATPVRECVPHARRNPDDGHHAVPCLHHETGVQVHGGRGTDLRDGIPVPGDPRSHSPLAPLPLVDQTLVHVDYILHPDVGDAGRDWRSVVVVAGDRVVSVVEREADVRPLAGGGPFHDKRLVARNGSVIREHADIRLVVGLEVVAMDGDVVLVVVDDNVPVVGAGREPRDDGMEEDACISADDRVSCLMPMSCST